MFSISRYSADRASEWDAFVEGSRNATFLLKRGYMDYHSDRFTDHSLMIYKGGKLSALLPANITEDEEGRVLHSHGGLTYGGLLLPTRHLDASDIVEIFKEIKDYGLKNGINGLDYKALPYIYASMPSQEDLYALWRLGARNTECNISCCIDLQNNPGLNNQQKRNLKKVDPGKFLEGVVEVDEFHALLTQCLRERHDTAPVHSAEELKLLMDRFPDNIRIRGIRNREEGTLLAGVCLYLSREVAHAQYICSSEEGRSSGALTYLFCRLITEYTVSEEEARRYFDFGISNEDHGRYLNPGLYRQKASLGGSGTVYQRLYLDFNA